jgi:hypothetical protein
VTIVLQFVLCEGVLFRPKRLLSVLYRTGWCCIRQPRFETSGPRCSASTSSWCSSCREKTRRHDHNEAARVQRGSVPQKKAKMRGGSQYTMLSFRLQPTYTIVHCPHCTKQLSFLRGLLTFQYSPKLPLLAHTFLFCKVLVIVLFTFRNPLFRSFVLSGGSCCEFH